MDLVEWLVTSRTPLELAQTVKENAALKDRIVHLEVEIFWMKVADRNDMEKS